MSELRCDGTTKPKKDMKVLVLKTFLHSCY